MMASTQVHPLDGPALADAVVADLRTGGHPAHVRQFEFWFNYRSGRDPTLHAAADEIIARRGRLTAGDIDALHGRFLSPWRHAGGCEAVTDRLADRLRQVSGALAEAIGYTSAQRGVLSAQSSAFDDVEPATQQQVAEAVDRLIQSARDGQLRHAIIASRLVAARAEIAALQHQLEAVRAEAQTDPTTSLPGRPTLLRSLRQALDQAEQAGEPLALLLCDIDYFGDILHDFGRADAEAVLRRVGLLLQANLRRSDRLARAGEDEFAAILPNTTMADALTVAERIRRLAMAPEPASGADGTGPGRLTLSIGATERTVGDRPHSLLARATAGLMVAKKEGRNRIVEMRPGGPVWTATRVA
jgi:diguanylate cyclase